MYGPAERRKIVYLAVYGLASWIRALIGAYYASPPLWIQSLWQSMPTAKMQIATAALFFIDLLQQLFGGSSRQHRQQDGYLP
jgi:hypothetical protein